MINIDLLKLLLTQDNQEPDDAQLTSFVSEYIQSLTDMMLKAITFKAEDDAGLNMFLKAIDDELKKSESVDNNEDSQVIYAKISTLIFEAINSNEENTDFFNEIINSFDREIVNELREKLSDEQDLIVEEYLYEKLDEIEENAVAFLMAFYDVYKDSQPEDLNTTTIKTTPSNQIFTKLD